jgi:hypothetical protein
MHSCLSGVRSLPSAEYLVIQMCATSLSCEISAFRSAHILDVLSSSRWIEVVRFGRDMRARLARQAIERLIKLTAHVLVRTQISMSIPMLEL